MLNEKVSLNRIDPAFLFLPEMRGTACPNGSHNSFGDFCAGTFKLLPSHLPGVTDDVVVFFQDVSGGHTLCRRVRVMQPRGSWILTSKMATAASDSNVSLIFFLK